MKMSTAITLREGGPASRVRFYQKTDPARSWLLISAAEGSIALHGTAAQLRALLQGWMDAIPDEADS